MGSLAGMHLRNTLLKKVVRQQEREEEAKLEREQLEGDDAAPLRKKASSLRKKSSKAHHKKRGGPRPAAHHAAFEDEDTPVNYRKRRRASPVKIKILVSTIQIMSALAAGLSDVPWPKNLAQLLSWCNGLFNIDLTSVLDVKCTVTTMTFYHWFLVHTYAPVLLVLIVALISRFRLCGRRSPSQSDATIFCVMLLFLVYPSVCRYTVDVLKPCNVVYSAGVPESYLTLDYRLDCSTAERQLYKVLAAVMFVLVPLGYPAGIFCYFYQKQRNGQLWVHATANQLGAVYDTSKDCYFVADMRVSRDFGFLFRTYEPTFWAFEVKELLKKLFFCAALMLFGPAGGGSSPDQLTLGFLASTCVLACHA